MRLAQKAAGQVFSPRAASAYVSDMADESNPVTGENEPFPFNPDELLSEPAPGQPPLAQPAEPGPQQLRYYVSSHTDMGCVRTNNEDSHGYNEQAGIYVVCDGMGGGPNGEVSSAMAVDTILRSFTASANSGNPVTARLQQAIEEANAAVWEIAQTPENHGTGTTVVCAALDGNVAVVGNVGDSRAYLLKGGHSMQITVDHSYRNELIRKGQLSVDDAMSVNLQGMESVICRAIGAASTIEPDFFSMEMHHGSAILLASDGLTRYLLQDEILSVIGQSSFDTACQNLIQLAKERGGADNITCLLLLAASSAS